jgi:hypothetical protein
MCAGLPDFSWQNIPKWGENIPNEHKICIPNNITYTNLFHSKALQNIADWGFLV